MTFTAEKTDSGDQLFATFKVDASSVHYPIGYIAWGNDSGTQNIASSAAPLPVQLFNGGLSSGTPFYVRGVGDSTVPVSGTVSVSGYVAPSTTVTVTGYVAPSTTVTVTGYTAPSTTVTVSNTIAVSSIGQSSVTVASGSITVTNDSTDLLFVTDSATPAFVRGVTDSNVPISVTPRSSAGGLQTVAVSLSSVATTVTSSAARLYGYHIGNPDTAGNVFVKFYQDDSAGVTLGTSSAVMDLFVPFGGGAVMSPDGVGIDMDSGISIATAASGGSTSHDAPSTTLYATIWFKDVSG